MLLLENLFLDFIFRWSHVLFGIAWIGLLYYFNFIQGSYFKEATAEAKADATQKLAPRALWWFRWSAMMTFITGVVLIYEVHIILNTFITIGALLGILMFLNVWLIIWPNQKIVCGIIEEGDVAEAASKALLASRTNTLFSASMLFGMLASKHPPFLIQPFSEALQSPGFWLALLAIIALELNAIFGKLGPMASVKGVIHYSLLLMVILFGLIKLV